MKAQSLAQVHNFDTLKVTRIHTLRNIKGSSKISSRKNTITLCDSSHYNIVHTASLSSFAFNIAAFVYTIIFLIPLSMHIFLFTLITVSQIQGYICNVTGLLYLSCSRVKRKLVSLRNTNSTYN